MPPYTALAPEGMFEVFRHADPFSLFYGSLDHVADLTFKMSQRESRVFVVMGLPCFILCKVLAEKPSLKIR